MNDIYHSFSKERYTINILINDKSKGDFIRVTYYVIQYALIRIA